MPYRRLRYSVKPLPTAALMVLLKCQGLMAQAEAAFRFWYFRGPRERILDIGRILIGAGVDKV